MEAFYEFFHHFIDYESICMYYAICISKYHTSKKDDDTLVLKCILKPPRWLSGRAFASNAGDR